MRAIKFRAWDVKHKEMHYIDDLYWFEEEGVHEIEDGKARVHATYEIMQFTGLKDKNGRDVYEGDICRFREDNLDDWDVRRVEYCGERDYPAFDFVPSVDCDSNGLSYAMAVCEIEVIGNIYENPELLHDTQD